MKIRLLPLLIATIVLSGCSLNRVTAVDGVSSQPPVYTPGEFNRESLYELLSAELAGQRGDFRLALEHYLKQARLTGDAGVAERATRVAQYLRDVDAITEAAELWRRAAPQEPEPYQISASILLHQKRFDEALPLVQRALAFDPTRMLAVIRAQIGTMPEPVVNGYLEALNTQRSEFTSPELLVTLALLHNRRDELPEALALLDEALTLDPQSADALAHRAELLRARGQYEEALATLNQAQDLIADDQKLQLLRVQLLFQSGELDSGVREAEAMLKRHPKDYQLRFYLALVMMENDRAANATPVFRSLLEQKPNDSRPHFYLGVIAQDAGQTEDAIAHLLKADESAVIYQALSRISVLLDTPDDKARLSQIIGDARNTNPDLASRLYGLEAEWLQLHDFEDEALILLEDALARFEDDISLLYTRAMLQESSDFPKAERDLRRILELEPDNSMALNALGYTLTIHTERYQEAYELIARALNQRPDDAAIIDSMGWVLFKLERYDESVTYLQRAYNQVQDPEVAAHLVQALWAAGQKTAARVLLDEALNNSPDNSHLQEAAELIGVKP